MQAKQAEHRQKIVELELAVRKYQHEKAFHAPILKAGVNIGLRFLENARETALGVPRHSIDRSIVTNGNTTAHVGNAEFHSAIFKAGFVPDHYLKRATTIYETLYDSNPFKFPSFPSIFLRLVNCRATLKALNYRQPGSGSTEAMREIHRRLEEEILKLGNEMVASNLKLEGGRIEAMVAQLEGLSDQIREIDRHVRRGPQPQHQPQYQPHAQLQVSGFSLFQDLKA